VRWVETVQKIASLGVTNVAECGPGKVLAGLTKRCSDGLNGVALADLLRSKPTSIWSNAML
jgi:[acyl-carrier-protein] S-malonyltransferase